ncbi:potassium-transporting ATPase subunit KdpA [Niastella yeongjuensis]|uniref:Potassium-transporting ATPase potassium-binding subunit n=1 Tax=Niastella yeongjuensis TaxID=354355 RepID=A0A1V9E9Y6_9BACT|nr:potassium-transporting ATPase subunit KdpA [Niastella yeongjuensis]OQP42794.1 potassium-transporting ATPase subunit KdpA [Niastella yeongjuensis]SEO54269.1 K+-transporting ATPase ATPase A chain [Niastella yeongjuensis]
MNTEMIGIIATFLITLILAFPLGKYIAKVFKGERTVTDFLLPFERLIYRFCGIDPNKEMNWKQHIIALLSINMIWFVYALFVLLFQGNLPLNPDGNPNMTPDLAFNTDISFLVNCNLQHYSGETGATYLSQMIVITFLQFVTAATGIAAVVVLFRAFAGKTTEKLGNFFVYFTQTLTRILIPLAIVIATLLAFNGTPNSFAGKDSLVTVQGDSVQVSRGPAAAMIAIKHLGTNGGGWYGANSCHPLENPNYFTNMLEMFAQVVLPIALVFAMGFFIQRRKLAYVIFGVMTLGMLTFMIPNIISETAGNPAIANMHIADAAAMEGKEVRLGVTASAYWQVVTTIISTGSINSMHDSAMPMSGAMMLLGMMTNCFYGGVGVGILNYFVFLIIAVFISGLMVGRTPEFMGRKIEAREMKIASLIALLHPFIILAGTALSSYILVHFPDAGWAVKPSAWLNNPGSHGFSEMLYEYTSSAANNGSGFEGLSDNNIFWNVSTGFVLILGRYLPIIGPVAIAGLQASKKYIPEAGGTLKTDTATFGIMTYAVIMIVAALAFFPALTLGPLAEFFNLK